MENDQIKSYRSWRDNNFVVDSLSIWNHLCYQNSIWKSQIQICWTVQMNLNREMTKTKTIDHEETYNFVVDNLSIWNHF